MSFYCTLCGQSNAIFLFICSSIGVFFVLCHNSSI
jgi:hypothetical protein